MVQLNYGNKIEHDPSWAGPMNKLRSTTDFKYLIALIIFCMIWLRVAIYAYANGNVDDIDEIQIFRDVYGLQEKNVQHQVPYYETSLPEYPFIYEPTIQRTTTIQRTVSFSKASAAAYKFIAVSAISSVLCIILLRWLSKFIMYTLIYLIFANLFVVICISMYVYDYKNDPEALMSSILCSFLFLGLLMIFLKIRQKIKIACEVIQESCKVVMIFPSTFIFPLLSYILYTVVLVYSGSVFLHLATIPNHEASRFYINFLHLINIFGLLWILSFVTAFSQMILSGTFATWYWLHDKKFVPYLTLMYFMENTFKYHLGTIAFGSLILIPCYTICSLLNLIKKISEKCSLQNCLNLGWYEDLFGKFEKNLRYVSHYAYTMCAIHGTNFIQSSKDSFNLFMRNATKVSVFDNVKDGFLFVLQLLIIGFSTLYASLIRSNYSYDLNSSEETIMLHAVFIGSTIITASFFMVLKTAIDTNYLCVLEDYERNDGSEDKPYMCTKLKNAFLK